MSDPFVGEIRMFAGNFAPVGWHFCDGALLPISENDTLFVLLGTYYGGDGEETFGLPNLQGRFPMHVGGTYPVMGEMAGVEEVTLTTQQIPAHSHPVIASEGTADQLSIANNLPAEAAKRFYVSPGTAAAMSPNAVAASGGSQPHENMQPFLAMNFIISLYGLFPQHN